LMEHKMITEPRAILALCFIRSRQMKREKITATPPVFESLLC